MNRMTWLELYTFLNNKANNLHSIGTFDWNRPVLVHDAETGDEFSCDTYYVTDNRGENRLVLITNIEKIFEEGKTV